MKYKNGHERRQHHSLDVSGDEPARPLAPTLVRAGHLLMRAMTLFESDREVAWRCLADASELLGRQPEAAGPAGSSSQGIRRSNGLALWQANRALEYIERKLGSKITTREVANQVALSKSHFSRAFKRSLGCSPSSYIVVQRVERAKLMMTSTRETLAAIALACGFADQSHFCKRFRRAVGMSPALWRRLSIKSEPRTRERA